ncbi:TPA: hydroxymyristoyl-ACP dehydratase [Kluyvera cryocrescens]|uniref:Hydroxymyristoyl-ACP dehydratase n=1 Tax=Kluyvera cryocrescens TaxID=580 RepID=A0AAW9C7R5_KLUCR|nr:hydroxymyristoyl-ACP dehydratase [Kluyvera cryocrescens]MCX2867791.1 hydroxymyristoyl-ACP dehydratase [Kluyvera cryocrescens]MDU5686817.1 hydroxymyristoyl-ACP dehydratase [Kluyvera cryocrescens]MDW3778324.1 hydroxymyristoyl-ACP dehydratase [Kluyvera cryocrescens]MEB6631917.1 hydroxymyristoyl-ACP dehydratase [Kluyvera cryocrescens]MEB7555654.1 hydroxymyristoyl-ACP dehydratase [Kluyvera cryocrescens]
MKPAELERRQTSPQQLEVVLHLDPALPWFRGHFAVQPLLPGVAQIDWVMHYASILAPGWRFVSLKNVKFQSPLLPGAVITLSLEWQETRQQLSFSYQRHDGDVRHVASSGKIALCR